VIVLRYSEMHGKEVIDYSKGENLGVLGSCDLVFDEDTGQVKFLILPVGNWFFLRKGRDKEIQIPWSKIEKIGEETIILNPNFNYSHG
jgi:YlmC/YmxH family sporulation protein